MDPGHPSGLRVLVDDDYVDGAESPSVLLRLAGHNAEIARDGRSALERAPKYRPDVVLLDLAMPRLSGYDVARRLPELLPPPRPVLVAVTRYGDQESRRLSVEAGIDVHLVKPVEPETLYGLLVGRSLATGLRNQPRTEDAQAILDDRLKRASQKSARRGWKITAEFWRKLWKPRSD
jgi:CheY-like chemotaxis protein